MRTLALLATLTAFTIGLAAQNQPPSNISVSPDSGSGATQNFTFTVRDPNGYTDIDNVQMIASWAPAGVESCVIMYRRAANTFEMVNDAGSGWSAPQTAGTGSPLENSQCFLDVAQSSAVGAATDLAVTARITFKPAYFGPQKLYLYAADNTMSSGYQHMGTWTGYAAPSSQPPTAVSITPNSGTGMSSVFSSTARSLNGAGYITQVFVMIGTPGFAANSCWYYYLPAFNWGMAGVYLLNDAGSAWMGPIVPGSPGTLENSQCRVDNPTVNVSGNDLTLTLPITFKTAYNGARGLWMYVDDHGGQASGWQQFGTWTVGAAAAQPPSNISVSPDSGSGATQNFTFTVRDPNGYTDIDNVQMIASWAPAGVESCVIMYRRAANTFEMVNDAGSGWSAPQTAGTGSPIENSQCSLNVAQSSAVGAATDLAVTARITFKPAYFGPQKLYLYAADNTMSSGYQHMGTWTGYAAPSSQPPTAVSITPNSGTGMSSVFSSTARSLNGAGYITQVFVMIGTPGFAANSCWYYYLPAFNWGMAGVYLLNDAGSAWMGPIVPGAPGTLENSQCRVDNPTVNISGNDLTLTLPITFKTAYNGARGLWMYVDDHGGQASGWQQLGTWTVGAPAGGGAGRRTGVTATGSYWGAAGEQIDVLSGNVNFAAPLIQAQGRAGLGATFALSYNSQIWQKDPGGTFLLGKDVGYGLGWTMQAGSIRLALSGDHYIFTTATGAEYKLDQNSGGVWTSRQGTYVKFEVSTLRLYFPDGSFWLMNVQSAAGEQDAGNRYPSLIQDTNGNQIQISYAGSSARITQIKDVRSNGSTICYTLTYNSDTIPHLTGITNTVNTAEAYSFAYASPALQSPYSPPFSFPAAALLQSVTTSGLGLVESFQYSSGELTQVTTPAGGTLNWTYRTHAHADGISYREALTRQMRASSGGTQYTWNITQPDGHASATIEDVGAGGTKKVWTLRTDAGAYFGLASVYEERDSGGTTLLRKESTWTADAASNIYIGAVITKLNPGQTYEAVNKSEQTLDIYGNVTQSKIYDYGNLTTPARTYNHSYANPGANIRNRLYQSTVTAGSTITLVTNTYDGAALTDRPGLTMHDAAYGTGYTARGNLTQSVTPGAIRNIAYDTGGMPVSSNDGFGHAVTITQSASANYAAPALINPGGTESLQTSFSYTAALQPSATVHPNNATDSQTYDSYGRVSTSTSPGGGVTSYSYDVANNRVTISANGGWQRTTTDGFGRTIKQETGNGGTTLSIVDTEYAPCACSPLGKVKRVSQPYAPGGTPVWTVYTYDATGRALTVTAPDGVSVTSNLYQGNKTKVTDPAGKWKQFTMDGMGNLKEVKEPDPGGGADLISSYTYDALNHLTQVSMPRTTGTQTRTYTYNSTTQRLTQTTTPESGTTQYGYNSDGSLQYKLDAKGQKTQYIYDFYGRLDTIEYYAAGSGTPDPCQTVYLNYSEFNLPGFGTLYWQWGRLTSVWWGQDASCTYHFFEEYQYSQAGQVTQKRLNMASGTSTYLALDGYFGYDTYGRMTFYQPPVNPGSGAQVYAYQRDGLGRLTGMLLNGTTTVVSSVGYGPAGQMTQMTYSGFSGPVYTETRQYNANLQMTRLTATPVTGTGVDFEYRFGSANNGRVWQVKDYISGEEVTYAYDALNRLVSASTTGPEWGLSFGYDGFGNLLQQTRTKGSTAPQFSLSVDAGTNRLSTSGYTYDANGNVTAAPGATYEYDGANRLKFNQSSYDLSNRRVWDGNRVYFYGVDGNLLGKYQPVFYFGGQQSTYTRTGEFVWFGGRPLVMDNAWVMRDRLGSVRSNSGGERFNYYPYGQEVTASFDGRTKFATYQRDSAGVDYAVNRYYANGVGRFLTPDPYRAGSGSGVLSDPASWNRYAYVGADPINFIDPTGERRVCVGPTDDRTCWDEPDDGIITGKPGVLPIQRPLPIDPPRKQREPDVDKGYGDDFTCYQGGRALMKHIQADFASFANYKGSFGPLGLETGTVQFGSGALKLGGTVSIHSTISGPYTTTIDTSVKVSSLTANSFAFRTVPGHVLFPATITFSAYDMGQFGPPGSVRFSISVQGSFANTAAQIQYNLGGSTFEDQIWQHMTQAAKQDCAKNNYGII